MPANSAGRVVDWTTARCRLGVKLTAVGCQASFDAIHHQARAPGPPAQVTR